MIIVAESGSASPNNVSSIYKWVSGAQTGGGQFVLLQRFNTFGKKNDMNDDNNNNNIDYDSCSIHRSAFTFSLDPPLFVCVLGANDVEYFTLNGGTESYLFLSNKVSHYLPYSVPQFNFVSCLNRCYTFILFLVFISVHWLQSSFQIVQVTTFLSVYRNISIYLNPSIYYPFIFPRFNGKIFGDVGPISTSGGSHFRFHTIGGVDYGFVSNYADAFSKNIDSYLYRITV